jgi:hypothetical protein
MYEGILVDVAFAGFFLAKVKNNRFSLYLSFNDPYYYYYFSVAGETKFLRRSIIFGSRIV